MSRPPLRSILAPIRWRLRNRFYLSYGMRGTAPINPSYGSALGTPIDRYYEKRFLAAHRSMITGRVLEIGDRHYTEEYGDHVTRSDVLNIAPGEGVTFVGDLTSCPEIPDDTYDCIVLTQVLQVIFDMQAALSEVHRIVKPGGSVLCTVAGISQVNRGCMETYGDRWRLTSQSAEELFATRFPAEGIRVLTYGNALTACCFLHGVPAERINPVKLDRWEPDYQLTVAVAATKLP